MVAEVAALQVVEAEAATTGTQTFLKTDRPISLHTEITLRIGQVAVAEVEVEVADLQVDLQVVEAEVSQAAFLEDSPVVSVALVEADSFTCLLIINNQITGHQTWRTSIRTKHGVKTSACGRPLVGFQRCIKGRFSSNRPAGYSENSCASASNKTQIY